VVLRNGVADNLEGLFNKFVSLKQCNFDLEKFKREQKARNSMEPLRVASSTELRKTTIKELALKDQGKGNNRRAEKVNVADQRLLGEQTRRWGNFSMLLNQTILHRVVAYLTQKDIEVLYTVNKRCNRATRGLKKVMDFSERPEFPEEAFNNLIRRFDEIEALKLGKMGSYKFKLDNFEGVTLKFLKKLDLSLLMASLEKVLTLFTAIAPRIGQVSVPYLRLTDQSLTVITNNMKPLLSFKARRKEGGTGFSSDGIVNNKIDPQLITNLLQKNRLLKVFSVYTISTEQLESLVTSPGSLPLDLEEFTVNNLLCPSVAAVKALLVLAKFGKLTKLKIMNIYLWDSLNRKAQAIEDYRELDLHSLFKEIFRQAPLIKTVCLGGFVNNDLLLLISQSFERLEKLKIYSRAVTDEGFIEVFKRCHQIRKLNVTECWKLNGDCFTWLQERSPLESVKVAFDQSRVRDLQLVLKAKKIRRCEIVNTVSNK
jgi:hypothetical protein